MDDRAGIETGGSFPGEKGQNTMNPYPSRLPAVVFFAREALS
jgi:hypothetical protein